MKNQIGYYSLGKAGRANEDRYRMIGGGILPKPKINIKTPESPPDEYTGFKDSGRGEIYAVMDGVGSAEMGMQAAQFIADQLMNFYTTDIPATVSGLESLLTQINQSIVEWGTTDDHRSVGASTSTRNFPNRLGDNTNVYLSSAELAAVCSILGKIPTVSEYMSYATQINETADETYQYLNFDQMADYRE